MKHYKKFLALVVGSLFILSSCQDDEVLDLKTYPDNQPSVSISDVEKESEAIVNANYNDEGILVVDGKVSRTYLFRFAASLEDIIVSFEVLSKNIPDDKIEISTMKETLPIGSTDLFVTVSLKDEDFSFAQSNYEEETYELGVRAYAVGYKVPGDPIESKMIIKKKAYAATCSMVGDEGSVTLFERPYSKGEIMDEEPISYSFGLQLDKPALEDTKIKFTTLGLDEKFLNTVTISPNEVTIPKGAKKSNGLITWTIKDDFLLDTQEVEIHALTISLVSDKPSIVVDKSNGSTELNISKVFRNFEYIAEKNTSWLELSKTDWSAHILSDDTYGSASSLIDGSGGKEGTFVYTFNDNISFTIDMASTQTFIGIGIDIFGYDFDPFGPKKVKISTSLDNENWTSQGKIDVPLVCNHYLKFYDTSKARYLKFEMLEQYNMYMMITEIYVYQ